MDFNGIPNLQRVFSAHSQLLEQVAQKIYSAARRFAPNNHVRESISVTKVESNSGGTITVQLRATSPDARAYEYGSGIHSRISKQSPRQLGPKGKILITPKPGNTRGLLIFPWDVAAVGVPRTSKGMAMLSSVEHPGVAAANGGEGYLRKAVKDTKRQARKDVAAGVAGAIKLDLVARFKFRNSR